MRRLRDRAWPTLSRIDFHAPRVARSWRSESSWQMAFKEVYGLFSGSSMAVVVSTAAAAAVSTVAEVVMSGCNGFGSGNPAVSMAERSCMRGGVLVGELN